MLRSTYDWACDQCGELKQRKSPGSPSGWRRMQIVDDTSVLLRADFCSIDCRDTWLKGHGLEKHEQLSDSSDS